MIIPQLEGRTLTKAHGARHDFILVPDFSGSIALDDDALESLCDRNLGIGADGFIRVVRTECADPELAASNPHAEWFLDSRGQQDFDGDDARVLVHYLRIQGIIDMAPASSIRIATATGERTVTFDAPGYSVSGGEPGSGEAVLVAEFGLIGIAGYSQQ